jgi:uncharacterized protein YjbI with pentapeptide repeats
MDISRRQLFAGLTGAVSAAVGSSVVPAVIRPRPIRVSQDELATSIISHGAWLEDPSRGVRAQFSNRDLSGLDFASEANRFANLRGADFTGADMTGVTGRDVSFLRASLQDARLSWSHFDRVTFCHASLRRSKCDNAAWGWHAASQHNPTPADPADLSSFQYTDAGLADLSRATIRGFFYEANFVAAKLIEADFSHSDFCGTGFSWTTFHSADVSMAKFKFAKLSHVNFSKAKCTGTDFSSAEVGYRARFADV